jgi:gamma-glutamylputrescine oxidase
MGHDIHAKSAAAPCYDTGMKPASISYYTDTAHPTAALPCLEGAIEARVCVIGGGYAGLNTAVGLVERGMRDVVLIEAQTPGFGASGRNGGFVFGGFSLGEKALLDQMGPNKARAMYRGTQEGVELIRQRIERYAIDCDAVHEGVIWANWFKDPDVLHHRQTLLSKYFHQPMEWMPQGRVRHMIHTQRYHDALFEPNAFHFHPLNYALGLARAAVDAGVSVYAHTPAIGLQKNATGWRITTPQGSIQAQEVVLACGGYLAGLHGKVDASVLPIATYVMATEPLGERMKDVLSTRAAVYDTRFAFDYYRPLADTRILWGGRISVLDRKPDAVKRLLYRDLMKVFPQLDGVKVDYAWSGLMSYARHEMPQIGQAEPGLWMAQAFGGHGVAPTTFAGEIIASAIADGDTRWQDFSRYGLDWAGKPVGFAAAQVSYWWAQAKDAWKAARERM